jgi:hypothetical protein
MTATTTTRPPASATTRPAAPFIFVGRPIHRAELLAVLAAVALFLSLALYQYRLPGLYYDEAGDVVPAMQLLHGEPISLQRGVGIHLFGRDFPVMIGDYWGTTSTYAVLPLFWLLGIDVLPIRLFPILAGAVSVVATWQLGRRLFGSPAGTAAALLLAISPTFIFWSRVGIYVIAHIVAITLGIWLVYLSWRWRPARWKLLAGAFLAGLGLTTKLLFVWFFIAIPAAYVALLSYDALAARVGLRGLRGLRDFVVAHLRARMPLRSVGDAIALAIGFGIGAFPVLYYNVISRGSYHLLRANLGETERGVDNRAFIDNVVSQARELRIFLDGGFFWFLGGVYTNPLATPVVAAAGVGLLLLTLLPEHRHLRRVWIFLAGWAVTIFILSCFSISILAATHLFILLPLPQLLVAACVVLGCQSLAMRVQEFAPRLALAVMLAGIVLLTGFATLDLRADVRYHDALRRTGGLTAFSDAIYPLAQWLDEHGHDRPYALDWGVRPNIMILTEGRVTPLEIYGQSLEPGAEFDRAIIASLDEPHPVYISQTEVSAAFPRIDRFRELVQQHGGEVRLEQVFAQRDGVPAYYVFTVSLVRAERAPAE